MPTTSVRRRISLFNRSWVVGPDLAPRLAGVGGEGRQLVASGLQVLGCLGVFAGHSGHDPVELGVYGRGVGLVEEGADLGGHVRLRAFGHSGEQVAT